MAALPPLPQIDGDIDLLLDVYTHNSLRMDGAPLNEDYGNTDRLAELGGQVLNLAVTAHFFSQKPFVPVDQLAEKRSEILQDSVIDSWMDSYHLKQKLRLSPNDMRLIDSQTEMRKFFHTYVGAVYIRQGLQPIQTWISKLIDPNSNWNDLQSNNSFSSSQTSSQPSWFPTLPSSPPPPLPAYYAGPSNDAMGAPVSNLVSLSLVNQTAAQKGLQITYPAEQAGQPHLPTWTVRCCLNGTEYGRGTGKSQKIAKEEAARQAWANLGWQPRA